MPVPAPPHVRLRARAREQVLAMLRVLDGRHPGLLARLRDNAVPVLDGLADVAVRLVPESDLSRGCSVAGAYKYQETPPAIVITRSASRRRQAFTGLHEFGHHLQKTDRRLGITVLDHPEGAVLEEVSCELFASRVLLPDELVDDVVPTRGPTAISVVTLYERSNASRAACCVRVSERLVGGGVVAVYRSDGTVAAASSSTLYPPARGSDQSRTPLIARALARPGEIVEHDRTMIAYSPGESVLLYGQAAWIGGFIVAVLQQDHAGWKPFAPPRTERPVFTGTRTRWPFCETCQDTFTRDDDECTLCGAARCLQGHCDCTSKAVERLCPSCFSMLARPRFRDFADKTSPCKDCE